MHIEWIIVKGSMSADAEPSRVLLYTAPTTSAAGVRSGGDAGPTSGPVSPERGGDGCPSSLVFFSAVVVTAILALTASRAFEFAQNGFRRRMRAASVRLDPFTRERARARAVAVAHRMRDADRRRGGAPARPTDPAAAELKRMRSLATPFSWSGLLALADAYARGSYPFWAPDEEVAESLYRECCRSPDPDVAGLAQQRFVQLRVEGSVVADADRHPDAKRIPREIAQAARQVAETEFAASCGRTQTRAPAEPSGTGDASSSGTLSSWFQARPSWSMIAGKRPVRAPASPGLRRALGLAGRPTARTPQGAPNANRPSATAVAGAVDDRDGRGRRQAHRVRATPFATDFDRALVLAERDLDAGVTALGDDPRQRPARHVIEDNQNVHDHTIARTTRHNLASIVDSLKPGERVAGAESVRQVTDFMLTSDSWDAKAKEDALDVVDSLNDAPNESAGVSQLGALSAVWSAIYRISCPEKRKNVRETLVDQLISAKERGSVVCSTGRIARIAGALDGVEETDLGVDVVRARPMWVVRDEIATLASRVRDEFSARGSGGAANEGDVEGTSAAAAEFAKRARAEYVDRLKFSENVMDPVIREFAEHL